MSRDCAVAASVAQYVATPGVFADWQWNPTGDMGPFAYRENGFDQWFANLGGNPRAAYRVEATAVPEPSALAPCGVAAGGFVLRLVRRRGMG